MSIVSNIIKLLSNELVGFSVGDYIISKSADIGTGALWSLIKEKLPKDNTSLEYQLYDVIEASVIHCTGIRDLERIAPACEILYCSWIREGHLDDATVQKALAPLKMWYVAQRTVDVWYYIFYDQMVLPGRETLYRWYMLIMNEKQAQSAKFHDEQIMSKIDELLSRVPEVKETNNAEIQRSQMEIKDAIFKPIMEENFCLNDIYISQQGKLMCKNEPEYEPAVLVDTTNYICEWCRELEKQILFLYGDPGAGKSSLVKMVAAAMATTTEYSGVVAFVDLHKITFSKWESPLKVLEAYLRKEYKGFFDETISGKRILILDGLDEIRQDVYRISKELVYELNGRNWDIPCSCIVSGRTKIIQHVTVELRCRTLGILPLYIDDYYDSKILNGLDREHDNLILDLRSAYWDKLCKVFGLQQQIPYTSKRFDELSTSPLLLFLVVWTIKHAGIAFSDLKNTAELYDRIFKYIYTRKYNREENMEYYIDKEYREYQQMLHLLGSCSYKYNSRSISVQKIYDYCKWLGTETLCKKWIQVHKDDNPSKLVLLFFLREESNEMDWSQTEIEFIHKTFYEYLAAVSLLELLYRGCEVVNSYEDASASEIEALQNYLLYLLSDNELDSGVISFIKEILDNESLVVDGQTITINLYAEMISCIFTWAINVSYPIVISDEEYTGKRMQERTYDMTKLRIRKYENNISKLLKIVTTNILANNLQSKDDTSHGSVLEDEMEDFLEDTMDDVLAEDGESSSEAFTKYDWKNEYRILDLAALELSNMDLRFWDFSGANLDSSRFDESVISGSEFRYSNLSDATFLSSIADRSDFSDANLSGTDFSGAQLAVSNFEKATLEGTVFELANLEGAYFNDTVLHHTVFSHACLCAANFDETVLEGTDFSNADLTRADFTNVDIQGAKWDNCIMESTILRNVKLAQFDLEDPNMIEILSEAYLDEADWTGVTEEQKALLENIEMRNKKE